MSENKIKILAVVGSTASGKSALAVELAKRLNGEVVSCDSMQIYRRMNIGTAKPTWEEQGGIAHHLIDFVEPDAPFSCADYVDCASACVREIASRGKLPILCGGTGLYLDAFLRGGFEETESDPKIREELFLYAETHGNEALYAELARIDPESAKATHPNNVKRVVRALEIYRTTGLTKTETDRRSLCLQSPYEATVLGLRYADRSVLYERIDRRVDAMLEAGLLEETRALLSEGVFEKNSTAAQAIGYKELLGYLSGKDTLDEAVDLLKRATRRYAKRQITWFGAKEYVKWIDMVCEGQMLSLECAVDRALEMIG